MRKPKDDILQRAVQMVKKTKTLYEQKNSKRKEQLAEIYEETMSYQGVKEADWDSVLKVNYANQVEQTVTSRITARSPKFIVSLKDSAKKIASMYYPASDKSSPEYLRMVKQVEEWSTSIQEYLNTLFDSYYYNAALRRIAKSLVRYGNAYGMVQYQVDTYANYKEGKINRQTADEYPMLFDISWRDVWLDPRFPQIADSPAVIRTRKNVRLSELYSFDDLFNLDEIKNMRSSDISTRSEDQKVLSLFSDNIQENVEQNNQTSAFTVDMFYGYFSESGEVKDEKIYEIWTVNGNVCIKLKEVPKIPVNSVTCFEDPEQHYGIGYVEPILGLQREYNFKMNSSIQFINTNLNKSWFYDPASGIDPRALANASAPGAIIQATNGMEMALNGLREIPRSPIDSSYFSQQNEIKADIQSLSFTIDSGNPMSRAGSTDTATAVRAKFYEVSSVYSDTLKHFEEFLTRIAYDILDCVAMNAENDVVVKHLGNGDYKWAKPEVFKDGPLRYAIRVEVGSSSFDSIENRREDALAKFAVLERAAGAGVNVDFAAALKDILGTFEGINVDKYIKSDLDIGDIVGGGNPPLEQQLNPEQPGLGNVAELTQQVVQGNLQNNV